RTRGYLAGRGVIARWPNPLSSRRVQALVHTSGPITLQIEAHVVKTDLLEFLHHGIARGLFEPSVELALRYFDPGQITMIADTELPKAEFLHQQLAISDFFSSFKVDFGSIGKTG